MKMETKRNYSAKGKIISSSIILCIVVCCIYFDKIPGRHGGLNSQDDPFWFWTTVIIVVAMSLYNLMTLGNSKAAAESDT
jgi:hypothetical protein